MKYYITIIKEEGVHCHLLPLCIFIQRKEITLYLGSAEGNAGQRKQGWSTSPGNRKRLKEIETEKKEIERFNDNTNGKRQCENDLK